MSSLAYDVMGFASEMADYYSGEGDFDMMFAWEHVVSMVNNIHHGKSVDVWVNELYNVVVDDDTVVEVRNFLKDLLDSWG